MNELKWKRVGLEAEAVVQGVLDRAPGFRRNVEGIETHPDNARQELTAVPPGWSEEQKYFFLVTCDEEPCGVVDLIKDYPRPGTVMLGLLLLDENFQSRGLGKLLYEKVEDFSRNELSAEKIRIGVNDSNPVHGFWEKMGFTRTGESRPHEGLKRKSIVWVMEKQLVAS